MEEHSCSRRLRHLRVPSIGFVTNGLTSKYSIAATFTSPDGVTPAYQLSQGVPAYSYNVGPNGLPNIPSSLTKPSSNVTWQQTSTVIPYAQEWQFGLQHQFGYGWMGEINYQGNRGDHLPVALQVNQIAPSPNCCFGVANAQSLRPFPQWLNVTKVSYTGNSNYNALLVKAQHYWKNGLSSLFNYTWSKAMDDVDGPARANAVGNQNVYNLRAQYGVAMLDIPQRVTLAFVYDLPFGAGGKFKTGMRVPDQIVGHWQLTGNASFQVGLPLNVTQSNTLGLFSAIQYPNLVGNPNGNKSFTPMVQHRGLPDRSPGYTGRCAAGFVLRSWLESVEHRRRPFLPYRRALRVQTSRRVLQRLQQGFVEQSEYEPHQPRLRRGNRSDGSARGTVLGKTDILRSIKAL